MAKRSHLKVHSASVVEVMITAQDLCRQMELRLGAVEQLEEKGEINYFYF